MRPHRLAFESFCLRYPNNINQSINCRYDRIASLCCPFMYSPPLVTTTSTHIEYKSRHGYKEAMAALPQPSGIAALNSQPTKRAIDESKSHTATPRSSTPPRSDRTRLEPRYSLDNGPTRPARNYGRKSEGARGSHLDIEAVDSALLREFQRPQRESTPGASPHRKRQRINGDRFVTAISFLVFILTVL